MTTRYPDGVQEPRQRGRPRVAERMEPVGVSLPRAYVQRLEHIAEERGMKVSAVVRHLLIMRLLPPRDLSD